MDFIARAGALIDKSHRVIGVLLVIIVVQLLIVVSVVKSNSTLSKHLTNMRENYPVYVVPGSAADVYRPESGDTLANVFVDFMIQSLYTYTYESYQGQYEEVKKFMTPEMLRFSDRFFGKKIKDAQSIRESALFIPNRQTIRIQDSIENGVDVKTVTLRGSFQQIINANVVQTYPVEIIIKLRQTLISKVNPFGYRMLSMKTRKI